MLAHDAPLSAALSSTHCLDHSLAASQAAAACSMQKTGSEASSPGGAAAPSCQGPAGPGQAQDHSWDHLLDAARGLPTHSESICLGNQAQESDKPARGPALAWSRLTEAPVAVHTMAVTHDWLARQSLSAVVSQLPWVAGGFLPLRGLKAEHEEVSDLDHEE